MKEQLPPSEFAKECNKLDASYKSYGADGLRERYLVSKGVVILNSKGKIEAVNSSKIDDFHLYGGAYRSWAIKNLIEKK